jgi:hypothetical protein
LIQLYRRQGLTLSPAVNAVESGLYAVWQMMSSGKLKVLPRSATTARNSGFRAGYRRECDQAQRSLDGREALSRDERLRSDADQAPVHMQIGLARRQYGDQGMDDVKLEIRRDLTDSEVLEFVSLVREWSAACLTILDLPRQSLSALSACDSPKAAVTRRCSAMNSKRAFS